MLGRYHPQILRNEQPCYLLPKRLNRSKNIQCQGNVLRSGLSHNQHRVNTLNLYCCEQKLNQTNSILLRVLLVDPIQGALCQPMLGQAETILGTTFHEKKHVNKNT